MKKSNELEMMAIATGALLRNAPDTAAEVSQEYKIALEEMGKLEGVTTFLGMAVAPESSGKSGGEPGIKVQMMAGGTAPTIAMLMDLLVTATQSAMKAKGACICPACKMRMLLGMLTAESRLEGTSEEDVIESIEKFRDALMEKGRGPTHH